MDPKTTQNVDKWRLELNLEQLSQIEAVERG